ncbi:HD domain-containing protein [Desulfotomaculum arcticum]|uniref:HD domain-containing protein n=2 Tax=Desulfotruncus TaxID=2867377 RepID=A0A1I2Z847_9FIRM|nr:HD domain-containing protein [Desulfotomaculum arcticum] [Desulfotruncus arcticus DSM 17038]
MICTLLKENYLDKHQNNVAFYAGQMGKIICQGMVDIVIEAALMHDVGKTEIDNKIIFRPGPLDEAEWEVMRLHPLLGASMIMRRVVKISSSKKCKPSTIALAVLHHHERWDGTGYPDGLAGDDIPLIARIIAVADAFDAMTTDRPYRKALSKEDAVKEIISCSGTQFDPNVAEVFTNNKFVLSTV